MSARPQLIVRELLGRCGSSYAEEAGIRLADRPGPLYQLLVLATLASARISADIAVAAAGELFAAGYRSPKAMSEASWQDRVDALGRGHYRRYDGASIFLREVQDVWPSVSPYVDAAMTSGAHRVRLPGDRATLAGLLSDSGQPARLAAALVRVSLSQRAASEVTAAVRD
jgi:hypothetical protein